MILKHKYVQHTGLEWQKKYQTHKAKMDEKYYITTIKNISKKKKQTNKMYMKIFNSNLNEIMGDSNLK